MNPIARLRPRTPRQQAERCSRVGCGAAAGWDAGVALRAAEAIDASRLSAERQTRFQVDVARAHAQRRQVADAAAAVLKADQLSPEMVRAMPMVKQLVADLMTMSQPPSDPLRSLANELGVQEADLHLKR